MKKILLIALLLYSFNSICYSAKSGLTNQMTQKSDNQINDHSTSLPKHLEKSTVVLEKGKPFSKQVTSSNSVYIINYQFDLKGGSVSIPSDCKLVFNGGVICNGSLKMNKTTVDASEGDVIFENCTFSGVITNTQLYPAWFGAEAGTDLSESLSAVLNAAYALGVKTIQFSPGTYYIKKELKIGGDKYNEWNIHIKGSGYSATGGTIFSYSQKGKIIVDQRSDLGLERTFNISDVLFEGSSDKNLTAIVLKQSYCGSVKRCMFRNFDYCIKITGLSYLNNVESSIFRQSHNGVVIVNNAKDVDYAPGQANNNFINYCHFVYCDNNPVSFIGSNGCVISDSNVEGGNGSVEIGSDNTIRNVRFERNLDTVPWIIAYSNCSIDAKVFSVNKGNEWKVVLEGNNNRVNLSFDNGQNFLALISYGRGSCFRVSTLSTNFNTGFVFDPDDEFVLNGYSNKNESHDENLIKAVYGISYGKETITFMGNQYKEITNKNRLVKSSLSQNTKSYLTMKFYANDAKNKTVTGLGILGSKLPIRSLNKWYQLVVCSKDAGFGNDFNLLVCDWSSTTKVSVAGVAVSKSPLYNTAFPIVKTEK